MQQYFSVKSAVSANNLDEALAQYNVLVKLYDQINKSSLDVAHKEIAYQQVVGAHKAITEAHADASSYNVNYIAIAVVLVIVSTVVLINPQLVGLVIFDGPHVQNLNIAFIESAEKALSLRDAPSSFSVTGKVTGQGTARLYLDDGREKRLVFDSHLVPLVNNTFFSDICLDTCQLSGDNNEVKLVAEVSGTILSIDKIKYEVDVNTAPEYVGPTKNIVVRESTSLNLRDYFEDADGDPMAFIVLPVDGLSVQLVGSMLTITPKAQGAFDLPMIASDPKESTRIVLKVES